MIVVSSAVFAEEASDMKWERVDRVVAVVNSKPIVESDFQKRVATLSKAKGKDAASPSRILDIFINEIILDQAADFQVIQVTDERIDNEIKRIMERSGVKELEVFKKKVEAEQGISFDDFRNEVRKQIVSDQLLMIAIEFNPPSLKEEKEWYEKNKQQLVQLKMKQIVIKTQGSGLAAEKAANEKMKDIQRKLLTGQSFEDLAKKDSEDYNSASKGGDMGWVIVGEMDPYLANQVMQAYSPGGTSGILKSSTGYHIIKFMDRRLAPFSDVEDRINGMLSNKKRMEQFEKWLAKARSNAEIRIYLENYKAPQG
jgi:putative peptidyl-prolyl cis-trans isomerase